MSRRENCHLLMYSRNLLIYCIRRYQPSSTPKVDRGIGQIMNEPRLTLPVKLVDTVRRAWLLLADRSGLRDSLHFGRLEALFHSLTGQPQRDPLVGRKLSTISQPGSSPSRKSFPQRRWGLAGIAGESMPASPIVRA